jgi:TetR/AcrR family transcriptional regulator, tetracycline repressor protein
MQKQRQVGQKAGLTSESVLDAARSIADQEGVAALTMRRLADALGVMPNSLYTYYPTKDTLLDALLDSLLAEIETEKLDLMGWRDALTKIMDDSRQLLLSHPRLVEVFLTRPSTGPNAGRLGEATFRALRRAGLRGDEAVAAFRILLIFSLGYAAFQAPRLGDEERSRRGESAFHSLPPEDFQEVRALATPLARPPDEETFLAGISWILDGVARSSGAPSGD